MDFIKNKELFNVLLNLLMAVITIFTAVVIPMVIKYVKSNTSENQRKELVFWAKMAIKWMEDVYKGKGLGSIKEAEAVKFLKDKFGLLFTEEQIKMIIKLIVDEFNKSGWDKEKL